MISHVQMALPENEEFHDPVVSLVESSILNTYLLNNSWRF